MRKRFPRFFSRCCWRSARPCQRLQRRRTERSRLTEVQRDYNDWCRDVNVRPLGKKAFTEELKKHRVPILTSHHQFFVAGRFSKE